MKRLGLGICLCVGRVFRPAGVPVLGYHSVDSTGAHVSIAPELFARQMAYLAESGLHGVSLASFMGRVLAGEPLPERVVVLTFDDGFRNFHSVVRPILEQHGFSATTFVPTDCVGGESFWYNDEGMTPLPIMSWDELRELGDAGQDIQSHGCSHRRLTDLSMEDAREEMRVSKKRLEQELGRPVTFFCPPYGDITPGLRQAIAEAGYSGSVSLAQGCFRAGTDPFGIPRQNLDYINIADERMAVLSMKACVQGTFAWYVRAKRGMLAPARRVLERRRDGHGSRA